MEEQTTEKSSWIKTKPAELESLIAGLAKEGNTSAKIGLILRDKHGIPKSKLLGKRISQIIKEKKITVKTEKEGTDERIEKLKGHITKNKKDHTAARALTKKLWKLRKLSPQSQ